MLDLSMTHDHIVRNSIQLNATQLSSNAEILNIFSTSWVNTSGTAREVQATPGGTC